MIYVFAFLLLATVAQAFDDYGLLADRFPDQIALGKQILGAASLWGMVFVAVYTVYSGLQFARINWATMKIENI